MRRLLGIWLAALMLVGLIAAGAPPPKPARAANQAFGSSRLEFGVSNFDSAWLASTGVPWRYRYQYLAAGVNTGTGWATWNSPPGQFATYFVDATATGMTPVFTYYMLLQSNPSTGPGEAERDFSNLNNPGTMNGAGRPVVVHVEPDLWGYLQQQANGGDASSLTASVQSSGFADVQGYPDTVRGFAQALLHLRDSIAASVTMAIHASLWSSKIDVGSSTDPSVNPAAEADKTAAFLASTGAWDAVFNDVDDHDAAWWELRSCGAPPCVNAGSTHWWDRTNRTLPNFTRYLTWVSELRARTGLPQVVWQVPIGNQYFLTMNNTCGHYQDIFAEYFLNHPQDLNAAGLSAVMFGAGNACQTTSDDSQKDGISNNGGRPTTDTLGGCIACNTHVAQYPDDDGGYLRTFVSKYYATPPPPPQTFPGGLFNAVTPTRVLDTRTSTGRAGALGSGQSFNLDLSAGVPATATAVTLNVTVTGPTAGGYLTVWPAGSARPVASNLNFVPGQTVANLVQVPLGSGRAVSFFNSSGSTDVVADLSGYTSAAGSGYTGQVPVRILDTRPGQGALGPGQSLTLSNLPGGATAVALNLTATSETAAGYLTAWPSDQSRPLASNLNFGPGQTVANRVIVPAATGVTIYNSAGSTDVIVDLAGYFGSSVAAYTGLTPFRLLDTRDTGQTLTQAATLPLQVTGGVAQVPAGARAVVLNVTATNTICCGFITVWPAGQARPTASDLNYAGGATVPNLVIATVGSGGVVDFYNGPGGADLVVDLLGWYA